MTKKAVYSVALLALIVLGITSCDEFFSSTWGSSRDYKLSNINVNAGNVDSWIATAAGNRELSAAIAKKIREELAKGNFSPDDKVKLQHAGTQLAIEASGLGTVLVSVAKDLIDLYEEDANVDDSGKRMQGILSGIQGNFTPGSAGAAAAEDIAEFSKDSITKTDNIPQFSPAYAADADPGEVGQAAMVLALAIFPDIDTIELDNEDQLKTYNLRISDGQMTVTPNATDQEIAFAALLNLINHEPDKYGSDPITGRISKLFGMGGNS